MICALIGGVRLLQRDRWRGPMSESDARTASKPAATAQEARQKGKQYRAGEPADLQDHGPHHRGVHHSPTAAVAVVDPAGPASAARDGVSVARCSPLIGIGVVLFVGLVLWLGRPRWAR